MPSFKRMPHLKYAVSFTLPWTVSHIPALSYFNRAQKVDSAYNLHKNDSQSENPPTKGASGTGKSNIECV
jgi:hypothetical protein